jgi:hypothetical protein
MKCRKFTYLLDLGPIFALVVGHGREELPRRAKSIPV